VAWHSRAGSAKAGGEAILRRAMPIYEYRCKKGHTFDIMQRFSDEPLTKCEICGAPAQRVLHAPSIHFKGSGFYNTDYGTKKRSREMKEKESSSKSGSSSSSSDSKDSKSSSSDSGSGSKSDSGSSSAPAKAAKAAD
jgi:putative FmdB family regulatory protein